MPSRLEETIVHASPGARRRVPKSPPVGETDVLSDSLLGRKLGQYQIELMVGQGSMARVYKARHLELGHQLLKIMDTSAKIWNNPGCGSSSGQRRGPRRT